MYGKLIIKCDLIVRTGMHIGANNAYSAIGAADSLVIRDNISSLPIIPGSSLKGKLRTLIARSVCKDIEHMPKHDEDADEVKRLFGSSSPIRTARAMFSDCFVSNAEEMHHVDITEVKAENTIHRNTSMAMPRFIERVNPGTTFAVRIVYDVVNDAQVREDLALLAKGMKLLQMDYLGGHGTRGYGRVSLKNFEISGFEAPDVDLDELTALFKEVDDYELLPVQTKL